MGTARHFIHDVLIYAMPVLIHARILLDGIRTTKAEAANRHHYWINLASRVTSLAGCVSIMDGLYKLRVIFVTKKHMTVVFCNYAT